MATRAMEYTRLGKSGLKVSKIILGCMSYGSSEWQKWVLDEEEGLKQIKAAYDLGINTFDTADVYSNGESERILGKAIKKFNFPREGIVVMTKLRAPVGKTPAERTAAITDLDGQGYVNQYGLSRKHIFDGIKASLKRLDLDYVDLLQCHRFDPNTPIEETMQALHDVVQAGYARYIGMSSCWAYQFHQMQNYAITKGLTPFISMQNFHNAVYREEEREMFPTLDLFGVGSIPWSPLARGFLARPHSEQTHRGENDSWVKLISEKNIDANKEINERIEAIAKKRGIKMVQVAVAYELSKPTIAAPIVGVTKIDNLKELAEAVHIKLTEEEVKSIEEPYFPTTIFGHQ